MFARVQLCLEDGDDAELAEMTIGGTRITAHGRDGCPGIADIKMKAGDTLDIKAPAKAPAGDSAKK